MARVISQLQQEIPMDKWTAKPVNSPTGVGLIQSDDAPKTNTIWRFYTDQNHRWKWQRLSVSRQVIAESHTAYKDYESCLTDAKDSGHVYLPSQAKVISSAPHRSYAK